MCVNYLPASKAELADIFGALNDVGDYKPETWKDYPAPIIRLQDGQLRADLAGFGFRPKRHMPPGVRPWDTMNARSETIGSKPEFRKHWQAAQLCLVPMRGFFEPNWETGKAERWQIGMADGVPFAVAGIWREWDEHEGGTSLGFSAITINADDHPVMNHFHKPPEPGEEPDKRSLIIVPREDWDGWLASRNPDIARTYFRLPPPELLKSWPDPRPPRRPKAEPDPEPGQGKLF